MEILNNRETAMILWALLFFGGLSINKKFRDLFKGLLSAFFVRAIVSPLILMTLYVALVIYLLNYLDLWGVEQFKTTFVWAISVAAVSLFKVSEISEDLGYFKKTAINNIKLIILVEFIVNYYSFSFFVEFLLIIPISIIIGALVGVSKTNEKLKKTANNLLFIFGSVIILHTIWNLIFSFSNFANFQTIVELSLPPLLTILFFPFLYFMVLFSTYENGFHRLNILIKDHYLCRYSKFVSFLSFNVRIGLFKRWLQYLIYFKPSSKSDTNRSIKKVFEMIKAEKNPVEVPINSGWCPHKAKDFLKIHGFENSPYHPTLSEWFSGSNYVEIGEGIFKNNIAYYVEGNSLAATTLKLVLNMNNAEDARNALLVFKKYAIELYRKAFNHDFSKDFEFAILNGEDLKEIVENKEISISKKDWGDTRSNGYSLRFVIEKI